jgi:hypothetical protein
VVQEFVALGLYVILDYQPMGLEQHPYNLNQFVGSWLALWKQVTCLPNFDSDLAGRVLVDVMNEPDSMNIRWEPQGDRPGAEQLYLATADALWAATPNKVLFMFEGERFTSARCKPAGSSLACNSVPGGTRSAVLLGSCW